MRTVIQSSGGFYEILDGGDSRQTVELQHEVDDNGVVVTTKIREGSEGAVESNLGVG